MGSNHVKEGRPTIWAYKNQKSEEIRNLRITEFTFASRALDIDDDGEVYYGNGVGKTGVAHHVVVVKTISEENYTIHNLDERNTVIDFEQEDYLDSDSIDATEFEIDIYISDIYDACRGSGKKYDVFENNCIHAQNRVKTFLRKYLKKSINSKILYDTRIDRELLNQMPEKYEIGLEWASKYAEKKSSQQKQ